MCFTSNENSLQTCEVKAMLSMSGKREDGVNVPEVVWAALKIESLDAHPSMKRSMMPTAMPHLVLQTKPSVTSSVVLSGYLEIIAR